MLNDYVYPILAILASIALVFVSAFLLSRYFAKKGERRTAFFGFSWLVWLVLSAIAITCVANITDFYQSTLASVLIQLSFFNGCFANLFGLIWLIHKYKKYKSKKLQNNK